MTCTCGCCAGAAGPSPLPVVNRPGQSRVETRIGTHGSILAEMVARLSSHDLPELAALRTRDTSDPTMAVLDAWATIADVLTFYQERIANESYLRTATERRSLVELAKLVGYAPRPGVAASVHLAFGLDNEPAETRIPKGTKVNSIPGPGETMEAFETADEIVARPAWSRLKPRQTQSQNAPDIDAAGAIWVKGVTTNLKPGDPIVLKFGAKLRLETLLAVTIDRDHDRTELRFAKAREEKFADSGDLLNTLAKPATVAPANAANLRRNIASSFAANADTLRRLAEAFEPALAGKIFPMLRSMPGVPDTDVEVFAMRVAARPFGHNAPPQLLSPGGSDTPPRFGEWKIREPLGPIDDHHTPECHRETIIFLDNDYPIASDSIVVIELADGKPLELANGKPLIIEKADRIQPRSFTGYGLSGKTVRIDFASNGGQWLIDKSLFGEVRGARVLAGSEKLALADAPIPDAVAGDTIELDGLYDGLEAGRWLIVEGDRADLFAKVGDSGTVQLEGLHAAELVMLAEVSHHDRQEEATGTATASPAVRGDTYHTTIKLAGINADGTAGLAYRYVRDSVTIYGNVAKATHGETRDEVLGSGNAAQVFQAFKLRLQPLTHVSADTPSGAENTLELRVDGVLWREAATIAALGPDDRKYVTQIDPAGATVAIAGDGKHGRRLPSGRNNVTARYRQGIGAVGNVKAWQISLLAARPLGVKDVINPLPATGGAGPDGEKTIRRNASLAIMAMDRLVSLTDYADFARAFGGIGKAAARRERIKDAQGRLRETGAIVVVIAGVDDAAISESSDLFHNLRAALRRYGDPLVPIRLKLRRKLALVASAQVLIDTDRRWDLVEPKLRTAMLDRFAFDHAEFGKPVFSADAIAALQRVPGVLAVDLDVFDTLGALQVGGLGGTSIEFAGARQRLMVEEDEIAWLDGRVRDTLILTEMQR